MIEGREDEGHWENVAAEWIDWARAPGHDAFWSYRLPLRRFLPGPGRATLDLGCGEGRVARELTGLGHTVTASDVSPGLLAAAEDAGSAAHYVLADATSLPFGDGSFDRVVAYNVLMDVPDMPAAVAEAARVLSRDGILTLSLVHPFVDRGRFATPDADAPFVVDGTYFGHEHFTSVENRDGYTMHFDGWSRPLEDYAAALHGAGLAISELREPRPEATVGPAALPQWNRQPLFLWMNVRPLS